MDKTAKKLLRCAIYTRKSTEHNLDLEFNSLDAQREACEAYIKSQAHEGWCLIRSRYDDGAVSGASLERPALQRLLQEVHGGHIDVIVVYKVDRLTRSLADFAKLVELFDQHSVSFVSVTQSFNTTTSMGRLTLNVMLSFAQFEREVIGERVRDKVAASKRKGIWVGGMVPLGYKIVAKKVVVLPEEAETVRVIFRRYVELGSMGALIEDLDRRDIRTKVRVLAGGKRSGGIRFGPGTLQHLLRNRFYIGEIAYRGQIYPAEHEPIVDRTLFEAVQARLSAGAIERHIRLQSSPAILTGYIFDDRGNRMSPTHTNKAGVRFRYYTSYALQQKRASEAGNVSRVPAPEIEQAVITALREQLGKAVGGENAEISEKGLIERHLERIVVSPDKIQITLASHQNGFAEGTQRDQKADDQTAILNLPWTNRFSDVKGIVHAPIERASISPEQRDTLLLAIAKARAWLEELVQGRADSFAVIAKRESRVERHIRLLAPLAFVSPALVQAINLDSAPGQLTVTGLAQRLPHSWRKQQERLALS